MDLVVGTAFLRATPSARRRLIETVGKYVTHNKFLQLIYQINPGDPSGAQITHVCLQLAQFNSNEHLWGQIDIWLTSEKRVGK